MIDQKKQNVKTKQRKNFLIDDTDANTIVSLLESAVGADFLTVRRTGSQLVRSFSAKGQADHALNLRRALRKQSSPSKLSSHVKELPSAHQVRFPLLNKSPFPNTPVLIEAGAETGVTRFIEEALHAKRLSQAGLESSPRLILWGPSGTGKTLLAGHIAARLNKSFQVVRLDAAISPILDETIKNINSIFQSILESSKFVFIDNIEALAKMYDDQIEAGELKRIVNMLVQGLDSLGNQVIVVASTDCPDLLKPALWKRFPHQVELKLPSAELRTRLWRLFLSTDESVSTPVLLGIISENLSASDIRELAFSIRRTSIISGKPINIDDLVRCVLASRSGALVIPIGRALSGEERRNIVLTLLPYQMSLTQMASLVGVSRQRVTEYLHGLGDRAFINDRER